MKILLHFNAAELVRMKTYSTIQIIQCTSCCYVLASSQWNETLVPVFKPQMQYG